MVTAETDVGNIRIIFAIQQEDTDVRAADSKLVLTSGSQRHAHALLVCDGDASVIHLATGEFRRVIQRSFVKPSLDRVKSVRKHLSRSSHDYSTSVLDLTVP